MKGHVTFLRRMARGGLVGLIFVTPFSTAAIEIIFPFLLVGWIGGWFFHDRGKTSIWSHPPSRLTLTVLLAYMAVCTWSVTASSYPVLSLTGLIRKTFEYTLLFIIAADVAEDLAMSFRLRWAFAASASLIVLYALIQEWAIHQVRSPVVAVDPIRGRDLLYGRMVGPYTNPNDLATFLMVALGVILAQIFGQSKGLPVWWALGAGLAGCLSWTQSMGALLGFFAGLFILILLHYRKKWVWAMSLGTVCMTTGLLFLRQGQLLAALTLTDASSMERGIMWQTGWRMVKDNPWIGVGLNTFMANFLWYAESQNLGPAYAHNCFLQIAAETGVVGLALFLGFLGCLWVKIWRSLHKDFNPRGVAGTSTPWLAGLLAALIAYLVQSTFDTNLYALRQAVLFWTLAGVAFGTTQARGEGATGAIQ